jgi:hypothetical protein
MVLYGTGGGLNLSAFALTDATLCMWK